MGRRRESEGRAELVIYTDGACIGNPGPGGWAAILVRGDAIEEHGGSEDSTTNNRMEMRAAVEGLGRARPDECVHVVTDSRYLHDGICRWIHGWKKKGWKKADGGQVLNRDLWEELDALVYGSGLTVTWEHVRGHTGHEMNERCDEIANAFARGRVPELRRGNLSDAAVPEAAPEALSFPLHLSFSSGVVSLRPAAGREGRPAPGHRRVRNWEELREALEHWGLPAP